jgi:hypothetical protein
MIKNIVKNSIFLCLLQASAFAGTEGNLGFCVHITGPAVEDVTYTVKQLAGVHCFYKEGGEGDRKITYPKEYGEKLANIEIKRGDSGIKCSDQTYHFEFKASSTDGDLCATDNSYSNISIYAEDGSYEGITFNFGNGYGTHTIAVSRQGWMSGGDNNQSTFPLSSLQLSNGKVLSGLNTLSCMSGWCTSGESPGSTSYIIYDPSHTME